MYGYPYGFYFDPTYILLIIGLVISLIASTRMKSTFSKYRRVRSDSGLTGAQTAERILAAAGIYDVKIVPVQGSLTDHYDPRTKTVSLSQDVYGQTSVASVCVAAHECGHAIQHAVNYAPLNIRSLLMLGIVLFSLAVLFQLVTLPVEFNASSRALRLLESTGILSTEENLGARRVLTAAALTYVAALASSILQLLRLIVLAGGRDRD